MAERLYKTVEVYGTANQEVIAIGLVSSEIERYRINNIKVYEFTSTRNNDAYIRLYVDRERFTEIPIRVFTDQSTNFNYPNGAGEIIVDRELQVGETLYLGVVSGSTASNVTFVIEYEIVS